MKTTRICASPPHTAQLRIIRVNSDRVISSHTRHRIPLARVTVVLYRNPSAGRLHRVERNCGEETYGLSFLRNAGSLDRIQQRHPTRGADSFSCLATRRPNGRDNRYMLIGEGVDSRGFRASPGNRDARSPCRPTDRSTTSTSRWVIVSSEIHQLNAKYLFNGISGGSLGAFAGRAIHVE